MAVKKIPKWKIPLSEAERKHIAATTPTGARYQFKKNAFPFAVSCCECVRIALKLGFKEESNA